MEAIRRYGFILIVLLVGMLLGHAGSLISFLIFCPLGIMWLVAWDDKRYRLNYHKKNTHFPPYTKLNRNK
ncbi:hypothetical protein [Enterococcus bulliens]|uniref:hypothetical protein n=1 Tax=uncultured Enterococcus sp. TaxID=167972 RepID=UPI0025FCBD5B|nr:hypothetical protein [uncultured Enterococcus sp.]